MGKALEKQAGGQLQKILSKLTDNPSKAFSWPRRHRRDPESSSATTVMVVGFVNSGIMELHQAIGVIMGSNVGTTVTSWILSLSGLQGDSFWINLLKPTSFSPLLAFIGILLYMGKKKKKGMGTILIGFAVLMTGMTTMSNAVAPLQNEAWFTSLFTCFSNPLLGVLVGALVTGIIQSSSASVGILQALSATGVITYGSAIPHHHGPEHRHLRHRADLLCGCQQECPPRCHGAPVLQHHRCDHLPCRLFLRPEYGAATLPFCEHHHRGMGHRRGALRLQPRRPPLFCCPLQTGWKSWPS